MKIINCGTFSPVEKDKLDVLAESLLESMVVYVDSATDNLSLRVKALEKRALRLDKKVKRVLREISGGSDQT
jgi:hypothetical protein